MYIKYLDPITVQDKFMSVDEIKDKYKPRTIEVIGELVDETKDYIAVAMSKNNRGKYKQIMAIPKKVIIETSDKNPKDVIKISYEDVKITNVGTEMTQEELKKRNNPMIVDVIGFKIHETEDTVFIAMERNIDGMYRTIMGIPKITNNKDQKKD